jgi:chromosome segregation ATPase
MSDDPQNRLSDKVRAALSGALQPLLIAACAWLFMQKLDQIDTQLAKIPEYTQKLAVLEARISERQDSVKRESEKLDRVQDHLLSVDRRVQRLEAGDVEIRRRLDRIER